MNRFLSNQVDRLYVNNFNIQFQIPQNSNSGVEVPIKIVKAIYPYDSIIKLKHINVSMDYSSNTLWALDLDIPFLSNIYNINSNTNRLTVALPIRDFTRDHQVSGGIAYLCPNNKIDTDFVIKVFTCFADNAITALTGANQRIWINLEFEIYSDHQY